jgi:RNA polymerase sigma-70 factor, ECF subfamily
VNVTESDTPNRALEVFAGERERLFAIAYRMLGSVEDAEDLLQEAFLRWHRIDVATITTPAAWLTTVVTRLALNQLESARVKRESYIGPWLPEPLLGDGRSPASESAELSDSLSIAFLMILERLSPRERAVFLLRDVFDYEYDEIARIVDLTEANCRQILRRAKRRLEERRQRFPADATTHRELLASFARAIQLGDVDGVVRLLTRDAVLWADGGGRVRAAAVRPVRGADAVARFLVGVRRKFGTNDVAVRVVNGRVALVAFERGEPRRVVAIDISERRIAGVYVIANPEKLRPLARSLHAM